MVYETERIRVLLRKVKSENWKKGVNQIVQLLAPLVLQKRLRDIEQKANYHESTTQCLKKRAKEILLKNNKTEPPSADLAKCAATVNFSWSSPTLLLLWKRCLGCWALVETKMSASTISTLMLIFAGVGPFTLPFMNTKANATPERSSRSGRWFGVLLLR